MTVATMDKTAIVAAFRYQSRPKDALLTCLACGQLLPTTIAPCIDRFQITIGISRCPRCLLEMINPRLTPAGYVDFYRDVYRQATVARYTAEGLRATGRGVATRVRDAGIAPAGSILDVGGGSGDVALGFTHACPDVRITVRDPNVADLAHAQNVGLATEVGSLEDVTGGAYDGALCVRALDHALHPVDGLRRLRAAVKPGGWLYVDVVDVWRMRHTYGPGMFWKIDHPVYWTPRPFLIALQRSGWTVKTHGYALALNAAGRIETGTYIAVCTNEER